MNALLMMLSTQQGDPSSTDSLVDASTANQLIEQILGYVSMAMWVLAGVLLVVILVKGITTALAVVKAADEPQVRQEKLGSFKYMAIGVGIAIVVVAIMGTVLTLAKSKIASAFGADTSEVSWLF